MTGGAVVLVFGKVPTPGSVKTRLQGTLSPDDSARLYAAFLRDTLESVTPLGADVRLYLAPSPEAPSQELAPGGVPVSTQRGDDLGARMLNAFVEAFAAGYERVVVLGSDHPTLPGAFVDLALEALEERCSVAIGPATDGGYYLLGMNELYPTLFREMTFSRPDVFARTVERIAETEASLTILPAWHDVDTPEALRLLVDELHRDLSVAPHTRRVLQALPVWRASAREREG